MIQTRPRHLLLAEVVEVSDLADPVVRRVGVEATDKPLTRKHFHQPGFPPGFFLIQAVCGSENRVGSAHVWSENLCEKKPKKKIAQAFNQIDRCVGSAKLRGSPLCLRLSNPSGIPFAGKGQPAAL